MNVAWKVSALAAMVTCVAGVLATGAMAEYGDEAEYVGHEQCRVCHNRPATGRQWTMWSEMMHRQAFEMLKSDAAIEVGERVGLETPPHESPQCLKCHVTAYDMDAMAPPEKIKLEDGVQCESCHGPASEHLEPARRAMFANADIDLSATIGRGNADTCEKCHNEKSPTWDPERYTLEDGTTTGFHFEQAWAKIAHPNPERAAAEAEEAAE